MADEVEDSFDDEEQHNERQNGEGKWDSANELEDDMGAAGNQASANPAGDPIDEDELFGGLDDDMDAGNNAEPQEDRGPPIDVHAPLLPRPAPDQVLLMKMPNILKVDPRPFDPATFSGGIEEYTDARGHKRRRPRDINVIRWRYRQDSDGQLHRESNARLVQWSDGTESIMLGDEFLTFDKKDNGKAHTYLYAVRYDVIEGQAHLSKRVTVAPASVHSKLHQRLKMEVNAASQKVDKVKVHFTAKDPEQEKAAAEKRAEEAARLKAAQERAMARSAPRMPKRPAFTAAYLEADEEEYGGGYAEEEEEEGTNRKDMDNHYRRRLADEEEEVAVVFVCLPDVCSCLFVGC
eukprot:GHRR01007348.1.p1 GENE.GHRR01007348.1~~GHRR01007348.1.p1  ORF type:complete len:349 (+),score=133.14 GHRR01007348.1:242-1288(+)